MTRHATETVRARIDPQTKREAAAALRAVGLTMSDAFRLLLVRVAAEKRLPFNPLIPNTKTAAAIEEARREEGPTFESLETLMADLEA